MSLWHSKGRDESIAGLGSAISGLTGEEAAARLVSHGPNSLREPPKKTLVGRFLDQFRGFLVILLIVSAVVSAVFGEIGDAIAIIVIVLINAVLGVVQENKAEGAIDALKRMTSPKARVLREGRVAAVDAASLVPGDIVLLDAGDVVPADLRLIEDASLRIEEAAITGESLPSEKSSSALLKAEAPLGDRANMAFMGTSVSYGRGRGVVAATGMDTEVGNIAGMLEQQIDEKTPLQGTLDKLGKALGAVAVLLSLVVFMTGLIRGEEPLVMFMTAVSLAVAAIPEGLTAIVTIVLSLGVQRMAGRNAIIRRLPAVETLGSADVICSDKTGTLTTNLMTVKRLFVSGVGIEVSGEGYSPEGQFKVGGRVCAYGDDEGFRQLLTCAVLCNDASFEKGPDGTAKMIGDPTEGCLLVAGAKAGIWKSELAARMPRASEVPFDSSRKRMSTIHALPDGGFRVYSKGAPDEMLKVSSSLLSDQGIVSLDESKAAFLMEANDAMADSGMRVLAMAYRDVAELPAKPDAGIESGLVFIGLAGMQDPARPETADAVSQCHKAGITPVMITGDHKATAVAIARQVGIADQDSIHLTGAEIEAMSDSELQRNVERARVYARVSPEHKVRIVDALRARGHIVAMTGDGVNDAPALKRADIGIAMGITGTDVSKGAADMVLADDNFATIVSAVEEGRTIFNNIRKSVQYLIRCNIGEIVLVFASIAAGFARPLLPIQILWVNLVTDSLPALSLGIDPPEEGVMDRLPRRGKDPILGGRTMSMLVVHGILLGLTSLAAFLIGTGTIATGIGAGEEAARTMCLVTLTFSQLFTSLTLSNPKPSVVPSGLLRNPMLAKAVIASGAMQLAAVYVPGVNGFLKIVPLTLPQLGISLGLALMMLPMAELLKLAFGAKPEEAKKESGAAKEKQ